MTSVAIYARAEIQPFDLYSGTDKCDKSTAFFIKSIFLTAGQPICDKPGFFFGPVVQWGV